MERESLVKVTMQFPEQVLVAARADAKAERRTLTATVVLALEAYLRRRTIGREVGDAA